MSLSSNDQTKAKKTSAVFVALAVIIVAAMVAAMVIIPYDPGTLAPATLSSNLCYGGNVTETDDYVFFRQRNGNLGRLSRENGEIKTVFEGDVSCLNPLDGFIYFIDGGDIKKTTYYGTVSESIGIMTGCRKMSLNGNWIYFIGQDFYLYKMRFDGNDLKKISDGCIEDFTADNRIVVYSDQNGLHKMASDGTKKATLVDRKVDRFCYTLDDIYYSLDGKISKIPAIVSGVDVGLKFSATDGTLFSLTTSSDGRGMLFYINGAGELHQKMLESERERSEEDTLLCSAPEAVDLYYAAGSLFFHNGAGDLFCVTVNGADSAINEVTVN